MHFNAPGFEPWTLAFRAAALYRLHQLDRNWFIKRMNQSGYSGIFGNTCDICAKFNAQICSNLQKMEIKNAIICEKFGRESIIALNATASS